jgi:hypothetical protein
MKERKQNLLVLDEESEKTILHSIKNFSGIGTTLESALGALVLGQVFGWRVLKLLHTPSTYRKYEKALGIEFKNVCPEITELGKKKSIGYAITEKLGSFWAVVMGKRKVPEKNLIGNKEEVKHHVAEIDKEKK